MSTALAPQTYLPSDEDAADLARVAQLVARADDRPGARYFLAGEDEVRVELPPQVFHALLLVAEALAAGKAVTVAPEATLLTTQQAADLLGVSRPTVVRLMDAGEIPNERHGNRRRVRLGDLLAYRERRREAQYAMLAATSVDLADEDDAAAVRAQLREVRRAVAARRRSS